MRSNVTGWNREKAYVVVPSVNNNNNKIIIIIGYRPLVHMPMLWKGGRPHYK